MPEVKTVHEGTCRCGAVRFEVQGPPMVTMACHCTGCQQMTASAFSLSSLYPLESFKLTQGEPVEGGLKGTPKHMFCPGCMSWLFTRIEEQGPPMVNIRATLLGNAQEYRPFMETFTSEALPWAKTGARHSFEKFPPPEAYPEILAEFAAQTD